MKKTLVIVATVLFVGAIIALIVPMWVMTAGVSLPAAGWSAIVLMVVFCFAVGGGLMFLIFYSARRGYDDDAHRSGIGGRRRDEDGPF